MKYYQVIRAATAVIALGALSLAIADDDAKTSLIKPAALEAACAAAAKTEPSAVRGDSKTTKMWCAVVDREGQTLAIKATDTGGTPEHPKGSDAWRGSIEIAIAKAYSAVAFSSNDQALPTLTLGILARPDNGMTGTIGTDAGPAQLFGIGDSNPYRPGVANGLGKSDSVGQYHHGIITFAGGEPVYTKPNGTCSGGTLIGAIGVSGDGVDQDDTVAKDAVTGADYCLTP